MLDAARALVLREGPRAASVAAIARESGAPVGTLYHRFGSRDGVLAQPWLRALERFQRRALAAAADRDPLQASVAMAGSQIGFARERPEDARLLLTLRRDDLLDADPGEELRARLEAINAPLSASSQSYARALGKPARPTHARWRWSRAPSSTCPTRPFAGTCASESRYRRGCKATSKPPRAGCLERTAPTTQPEAPSGQATSRSFCASASDCSFFSDWFSIWRMRSRVTLNVRPTSSSVRGCSPPRP